MIGTDIAQAAVIASIPLLATQSSLPIGWIYMVSFLTSTLGICFAIARSAIIPSLVGRENLLRPGRPRAELGRNGKMGRYA